MKPPKRMSRKRKATSDDVDDEIDGDLSNGSGDEWAPNGEDLLDKSINSTLEESHNTSNGSPDDLTDVSFDTTSGFTLKIIKKYKQSKHPVWFMFGYLMKDDKIVQRVKDRFFCKMYSIFLRFMFKAINIQQ